MGSGGSCACCASVPVSNVDNAVTRSCSLWWSTAVEDFEGWDRDAYVGPSLLCRAWMSWPEAWLGIKYLIA